MARFTPPTVVCRQRGATLFVTLILLMILTMTGVYTMASSRLQLLMTASFQFNDQAFQAAESGLQTTMSVAGLFDRAFTLDQTTELFLNPAPATTAFVDANGVSYREKAETTTRMRYVGTLVSGFSHLAPAYYEIESVGLSGASAESVNVQGVVFPVPELEDRTTGNKID